VPKVTLTVEPATILQTENATLRWSGEQLTSCNGMTSIWNGSVGTSGERQLSGLQPGTYEYVISCATTVRYKHVNARAILTVNPAPPPQQPAATPPATSPPSSSGGGALGPLWLLLLLALTAVRRQALPANA
jgi:hypothetical protein